MLNITEDASLDRRPLDVNRTTRQADLGEASGAHRAHDAPRTAHADQLVTCAERPLIGESHWHVAHLGAHEHATARDRERAERGEPQLAHRRQEPELPRHGKVVPAFDEALPYVLGVPLLECAPVGPERGAGRGEAPIDLVALALAEQ